MANMTPPAIEADLNGYLDLCKDDVVKRMGISFSTLDSQGRPILDACFSKEGWTFGELKFNSLISMYDINC